MGSWELISNFYERVIDDIEELKTEYPFSSYYLPPPSENLLPVRIDTVAVCREVIERTNASEKDFTGSFSKRIEVLVPSDYRERGCRIYGGSWIDVTKLSKRDCHFWSEKNGKFLFCVGVPKSFCGLKNVILENVKTVENMLTGYELFQRGLSDEVGFKAYSHGLLGQKEYERDLQRYNSK